MNQVDWPLFVDNDLRHSALPKEETKAEAGYEEPVFGNPTGPFADDFKYTLNPQKTALSDESLIHFQKIQDEIIQFRGLPRVENIKVVYQNAEEAIADFETGFEYHGTQKERQNRADAQYHLGFFKKEIDVFALKKSMWELTAPGYYGAKTGTFYFSDGTLSYLNDAVAGHESIHHAVHLHFDLAAFLKIDNPKSLTTAQRLARRLVSEGDSSSE